MWDAFHVSRSLSSFLQDEKKKLVTQSALYAIERIQEFCVISQKEKKISLIFFLSFGSN